MEPGSGRPRVPRAVAGGWPLLQREAEYATISSALIGQPEVSGIVIIGAAGVGKTTLARMATQSLPGRVQWVAATQSMQNLPLGAFAHFVGSTFPTEPVALLAAVRRVVLAQKDYVLCIDDAHLLDQLSAMLLHRLAIDGAVRIVATVRSGEAAPDAITSLWKDGYLRRLTLHPFSKGQCAWLTEQALGGRVEDLSVDQMWEISGGNALFMRHLVEAALEAGTLRQVRGVWQFRGRAAVTSELGQLLDARVEQLPSEVRHTLELLTFCEPIDLDTLTRMAGAEAVEQAESQGLIRVNEDRQELEVRFAQPLFGEVIRRRLGVAAARDVRGELVRALKRQPVYQPAQRIRLAELMLDSEEIPEPDLLVAAAQDALALTDISLGMRLAQAAVRHGGGLAASLRLARAQFWDGRAAACEATLSAYDPDTMTEEELLDWGAVRIPNLQWALNDIARAHEVLQMLHSRVAHPTGRVFVDGLAALMMMAENHFDEALVLSDRVLGDPLACQQTVDRAVIAATIALALMGRFDRVAEVAARNPQADDKGDGLRWHFRAIGEMWGLVFAGLFDAAEQRAAGIARVSCPGQSLAWAMDSALSSAVDVGRGRFRSVVSRLEQTLAVFTSTSTMEWNVFARLLLAQSYCALGEVDLGRTVVAELRAQLGSGMAAFEPQLRLTEAWLAAARGEVSTAVDLAMDAADMARCFGQRAIELRTLHDAIRFGDRTSLQRIVEVARDVDGLLAPLYGAHATALARRDAAAVYEAAEQFEQIGALLSATDAAAQASALFDAAGDRRRAMKAAVLADRLAAVCGGVRTPALILATPALPLSTRESEIATLIAQGLSNREIAERLVVSTRTVEGHIYRACTKRGLCDREELAAYSSERAAEIE